MVYCNLVIKIKVTIGIGKMCTGSAGYFVFGYGIFGCAAGFARGVFAA